MSIFTAQVNRSKLYHTIAAIRPINDARINRLDLLGGVIVPFLCVAVVNLVRLFCTH
jgi:hypothetical protein